MTHEELLEVLNQPLDKVYANGYLQVEFLQSALRAVVELHKPNEEGFCSACFVSVVHFPYPCPTIQAIEKELI